MLKPLWRFIARIIVSLIFKEKDTAKATSGEPASSEAKKTEGVQELKNNGGKENE